MYANHFPGGNHDYNNPQQQQQYYQQMPQQQQQQQHQPQSQQSTYSSHPQQYQPPPQGYASSSQHNMGDPNHSPWFTGGSETMSNMGDMTSGVTGRMGDESRSHFNYGGDDFDNEPPLLEGT
jgi:hypothetical protein